MSTKNSLTVARAFNHGNIVLQVNQGLICDSEGQDNNHLDLHPHLYKKGQNLYSIQLL